MLLEESLLQLLRLQVVQREGYLVVLVILVVVVHAQVGLLFGRHHALHQLYGRVVLTAVVTGAHLDHHLADGLVVGLQLNIQLALGLRADGHDARLVAHGRERHVPALVARYGVAAVEVGNGRHVVTLIDHAGIGNAVARLSIGNDARQLLAMSTQRQQQADDGKHYMFQHFHHCESQF